MAKPDKLPVWATSADAAITEPSESKKAIGWQDELPPKEWFNWWQNKVHDWVAYFNSAEGRGAYASIRDMDADTEAGTAAIITPNAPAYGTAWTYQHPAALFHVCSDSLRVYAATTDFLYCHNAETGALLWTYPASALGTIYGICCDGNSVFLYGTTPTQTIFQLDAETGQTQVLLEVPGFALGGPIRTDGQRLYVAEQNASGPDFWRIHHIAISVLSGGSFTTINTGEILIDFVPINGQNILATVAHATNSRASVLIQISGGAVGPWFAGAGNGAGCAWDGRYAYATDNAQTVTGSGFLNTLQVDPDRSSTQVAAAFMRAHGQALVRVYTSGPSWFVDVCENPQGKGRTPAAAIDLGLIPCFRYVAADAVRGLALDPLRFYVGGEQQTALAGNPTLAAFNLDARPRTVRRLDETDPRMVDGCGRYLVG